MHGLQNAKLFRESCYINGQWIPSDSGKTISVINPFDGKTLGQVPQCGTIETRRAIDAASQAWDAWRARSAKEDPIYSGHGHI